MLSIVGPMELRDFAEQVLFATTLEEKLRSPGAVADERPGVPLIAPEAPGRPNELRFKSGGSGKADFPGVHRLDDEVERGRLLHFFANHELLATELMALVLLRFPEAPAAFRKGIFQTLKDEQAHTRMYVERMQACGIHFGELPVSGYFWRTVAPMENPMDYVSSLSLTFEQANLDFCRHFAQGFRSVGDEATAKLLDKIHRDEIGHVAYGLKWFRRWKNPQQSDWEAFCRQLKFPLSPQRAKGPSLNVEDRRAAGLDSAFIAELNVYSQSKGRTPAVFVFNPLAEGYIARGKSFTPAKHQTQLIEDLANLPQFLCRQDDIVLTHRRPSVEFLSEIKEAGFALPEFVELADGKIDPRNNLAQRKLGALRPWAWGPDSVQLLGPIFACVTGGVEVNRSRYNERLARLYSKAWSAEFLRSIVSQHEDAGWLCTENEVGVPVDDFDDALEAISGIRARGHHKVVVKESLGLAGGNALRLWEPELLPAQRRWLESALQGDRKLVIEPWLERELDFSVQLEVTPQGPKLIGYAGLINDHRGQFQGNWAAPNFTRHIPRGIAALFPVQPDITGRIQRLYGEIISVLGEEVRRADYLGPVGIDAFIYRTPTGESRLKPVVEINPRYTMGRLTLELMRHTSPGTRGLFSLRNRANLLKEGFPDFSACARSLRERFPLRLEGEPVAKIREGVLCLNDPHRAQVCMATFQAARTAESLFRSPS